MAEIVLLSGDELMVGSALVEERAAALGDLDPAWVLTDIAPGSSFADDLAATAMLGLGTDFRVVVVRRAGALDQGSWDALLRYVADPPGHVRLILEGQGWTAPARSRALGDAVRKAKGRVRREDLPAPGRRAEAIRQRAAASGLRLDAAGARYLAEYLGDEIGNLTGHLEQLAAVHGENARLGEAEVARLFQGSRHGFQWDITDALDRGDGAAALEYMHGAFDHMHPLQVHAALVSHYRRLLAIAGRGLGAAEVATELGLKDFPAKKVAEQAARLGADGARRAYELLGDADVALRGGSTSLDERTVLDLLVVQLCNISARSAPPAGRRPRR